MMKSQNSSEASVSKSRVLSYIEWGISLLGLVVCGFFVCPFLLQLMGAIVLGTLMASQENVRHSVDNPNHQITALVIADDCGATCGCTVRVDLKTENQYLEEIWRGIDVCDASIGWLNDSEFIILADNKQRIHINVISLGLSP